LTTTCYFGVRGLGIDDGVWVPTVFTKNRDRLLEADVAGEVHERAAGHKEVRKLLSDEHFSVDGTLIEAWASMKSFQPKPTATRTRGEGRRRVFGRWSGGGCEERPSNTKPTKTEPTAQPQAEDRSRNDRNARRPISTAEAHERKRMHPSPIPRPGF